MTDSITALKMTPAEEKVAAAGRFVETAHEVSERTGRPFAMVARNMLRVMREDEQ